MHPHMVKTPETEWEWFEALMRLARYLRTPEGCPWDREQKACDFARFADGEVHELLEAIQHNDRAHIAEEFGDALFCLLATAAAAEEEGLFTLEASLKGIHEKMIRRHDHVFGERKAASPQDAIDRWNAIKAQEKAAKEEARTNDSSR